jgi:hypothetical protein
MSKKSRRRNKRLLALAGLAGAVALSRRKGTAAADVDSGRGGDSSSADARVKANTTPAVKTSTTIQDNKPAKRSNASIAGDFISKVTNPKKMEYGMQMSNDLVSSKLPGRTRTPIKADNSGIIKQYKSGGRVKGCGKALRGFGRAMKGKK